MILYVSPFRRVNCKLNYALLRALDICSFKAIDMPQSGSIFATSGNRYSHIKCERKRILNNVLKLRRLVSPLPLSAFLSFRVVQFGTAGDGDRQARTLTYVTEGDGARSDKMRRYQA